MKEYKTLTPTAPTKVYKSTIRNKKQLVAPGIATRSKDATSGSWPYY